jgi:hypothetical protein
MTIGRTIPGIGAGYFGLLVKICVHVNWHVAFMVNNKETIVAIVKERKWHIRPLTSCTYYKYVHC